MDNLTITLFKRIEETHLKKVGSSLRMKITLVFALFGCVFISIQASSAPSIEDANTAFSTGKYEVAMANYEGLIQGGKSSLALYYNLGNSYYRLNNIPKAILNYKKAYRLAPKDKEVLHNIDFLRSQLVHKVDRYPELFYKRWMNSIMLSLGSTIWALLALFCLWASLAAFYKFLQGSNPNERRRFFSLLFLGFFLSIFFLAMGYQRYSFETNKNEAILMTEGTSLKSGPSGASKDTRSLSPGTAVQKMEKIDNWVRVKLEDGSDGWLELSSLEFI